MQRKMYLDVDGVIVVWDRDNSCVELSRGYGYLMRFCKLHDIQPCWLSTWCNSPDQLTGISRLLWPDCCTTMASPIITELGGRQKSDCVDYQADFVWIEDGLGEYDTKNLKKHNALHRFFWTSGREPDCLYRFIEFTCQVFNIRNTLEYHCDESPQISRPKHDDMV